MTGAVAAAMLGACGTPTPARAPDADLTPEPAVLRLAEARMPDGYRLPLQRWSGVDDPRVIVLGLHGFNDYSHAFAPLAEDLAEAGITTYAVDQRGFGATLRAGRWHGSALLQADLRRLIALLRHQHPRARLVVIGESMGAAVALAAATQRPLDVDGILLIAPAVWSRASMPWYQRLALRVAVQTVPWLELTGEGIPIAPTDNQSMLNAMSRDPLVIKSTRVDALWGVTNLMDQAAAWPATQNRSKETPMLILYGEQDSIIPPRAFCRFMAGIPLDTQTRLALYADGWHMLPRDLQGVRVREDILQWLQDPAAPLPSGAAIGPDRERLARFCRPHSDEPNDDTLDDDPPPSGAAPQP